MKSDSDSFQSHVVQQSPSPDFVSQLSISSNHARYLVSRRRIGDSQIVSVSSAPNLLQKESNDIRNEFYSLSIIIAARIFMTFYILLQIYF
jgi:hypothetical protein